MFDHHKKKALLLFAAADVILTILAFEAAYQTRLLLPLPRTFFIITPVKTLLLGFTLALWLVLGRAIGVYVRLYGADTRAAIVDTFRQVGFGGLGLVMFAFLLRLDISRPFIGLFLTYNLTLLVIYRVSAGRLRGYIRREFGAEAFYVVVGDGPQAIELARRVEASGDFGARLRTFVDLAGTMGQKLKLAKEYPVKALDALPDMLRRQVVDEVLFAVEAERLKSLEEILLLCDELGVRTRLAVEFFPHVNSRVSLDRFAGRPLLTFSSGPTDELGMVLKRALDIVFALVSLVVLAAPMALISGLIRLTSAGPAIFDQTRCGLNGRRFRFFKFRSMVKNADEMRPGLEKFNDKDGPAFKLKNDPRVTNLGRTLRRFSIDEWPQFWNILRGDMSFVGPRPAVPSEVDKYEPWQRRRLRMRPGLTCLWTLEGRDEVDFETWMRLDLEYIDNWSIWLDLKILLHSIPAVLAGRGAH